MTGEPEWAPDQRSQAASRGDTISLVEGARA